MSDFLDRLTPEARRSYDREMDFIRFLCQEGWDRKLAPQFAANEEAGLGRVIPSLVREVMGKRGVSLLPENATEHEYVERLRFELNLLYRMGFVRYFLIVWDVYRFARERRIPRGDGRGSVCASLVAYLLDITRVDPIRHNLLFARFLNTSRKDMPDIDMDFSQRRRGEVLQYIYAKYGREHVAAIATFNSLKGKSAVQSVGRVLGVPATETHEATQAILARRKGDARVHKTVEDSLSLPGMKEFAERYPEVIRHAIALEGQMFAQGIHAAGIVISSRPLAEFVPLVRHGDEIALGVEMTEMDGLGLLKLDCLGLRNLDITEDALALIQDRHDPALCRCPGCQELKRHPALLAAFLTGDWDLFMDRTPIESARAYTMLGQGLCAGIMQLETPSFIKLMERMKPRRFTDISAANALQRPGPLRSGGMERFLRRMHGEEATPQIHPIYDGITAPTYGVLAFQEQIMMAFHLIGGFPEGDTERMRKLIAKSMGKEALQEHYDRFAAGAKEREFITEAADEIWKGMVEAGAYAFNDAHATGYSYISAKQAFVKSHYPSEYLTACLNSTDRMDRISGYMREATRLGIPVRHPDINRSRRVFTVGGYDERLHIQAGFAIVRGVGDKAIPGMEALIDGGPYHTWEEFRAACKIQKLNKTVARSLLASGALDTLGVNPKPLLDGLEEIWSPDSRPKQARADAVLTAAREPDAPRFTEDERTILQAQHLMMPPERSLIDCYKGLLGQLDENHAWMPLGRIEREQEFPSVLLVAVVTMWKEVFRERELYEENTDSFLGWGSMVLEDPSGFLQATIDPDTLDRLRPLLKKAEGEVALIRAQKRPFSDRVNLVEMTLASEFQNRLETEGLDASFTPFERYLLMSPLTPFAHVRDHYHIMSLAEARKALPTLRNNQRVRVWGYVLHRRMLKTRSDGRPFVILTLEESGEQMDVAVWPDAYERFGEVIGAETLLAIEGTAVAPNARSLVWKLGVDDNGRVAPVRSLDQRLRDVAMEATPVVDTVRRS
jgi:DNA-directed DNA polymerase III PolC